MLKRFPVKYIRDYIKKKYKKNDECFICNLTNTLEFHHLFSVSELFNSWCIKNSIKNITTVEEIKKYREQFELDNLWELSNENALTLCKQHHERLHNIFGQRYANSMVPKVKNWVRIQKEKIQ